MKRSNEEKYEELKREGQRKLEENFWRGLVLSAKELLPDELGEIVGEYTDPKNIEPMLLTGFKYMVRSLDVPIDQIRIVVGFNGVAQRMVYAVEVINVHSGSWKKVEFPMSMFLGNAFDSAKRTKTTKAMQDSIKFMRFFKPDGDGTTNGKLILADGTPLQLSMNNKNENKP